MKAIARTFILILLLAAIERRPIQAQAPPAKPTDASTPLHLLKPDYPVPYGPAKIEQVTALLERVRTYLESATPPRLIDSETKQEISDYSKITGRAIFEPGAFRLISYEWGVTYSGMLLAGQVTGDPRYTEYTTRRIKLIADLAPHFREQMKANPQASNPLRSVLEPRALDDAGSMCAAMIRASRAVAQADLRPLIDNYINYISRKEFRLTDGTLARNRPHPNTLWLDDLYMSVPALAQMGKSTDDRRYFDDAARQILQFSQRMFVRSKGLYVHGWVQGMESHPEFHWARANGWALLATEDLLDVLPVGHPSRGAIMDLLRAHIRGLAACQSGSGFWHQLLDRNDSYLETSATAIYTYGIAHAVNQRWIDPLAYGPMALLGWNAISTKVSPNGQVEGTCVGTGMAFDPAFYYYRPTNVYAAHGYGPVVMAGAEMIRLLKNYRVEINDTAAQFYLLETQR
jgi:rhamnogalacturonyl hydrolase YesR